MALGLKRRSLLSLPTAGDRTIVRSLGYLRSIPELRRVRNREDTVSSLPRLTHRQTLSLSAA
ncbi:hypothetical protein [Synechococcus elongatus]|uniref:hypothetical protein n=1 Tax=Synechococcus elongatus TaxID=32046 RepID=UPI0030CFFC0D